MATELGNLAQGQFDEFTTFRRACDALNVAWYYGTTARRALLGPVPEAEASAHAQRAATVPPK